MTHTAPTVGVLDPIAHAGRARLAGLVFWFVLPVICLFAVISASTTFAHRVNAQPQGTPGTYVAEIRSCQGNVCQIAGTFRSDNGYFVVPSVLGDYRWKVGESHRVVFNPQAEVIALPATWNPAATVVGGAGAAIFLIGWLLLALGALRRHWRRSGG